MAGDWLCFAGFGIRLAVFNTRKEGVTSVDVKRTEGKSIDAIVSGFTLFWNSINGLQVALPVTQSARVFGCWPR